MKTIPLGASTYMQSAIWQLQSSEDYWADGEHASKMTHSHG